MMIQLPMAKNRYQSSLTQIQSKENLLGTFSKWHPGRKVFKL